MNYEKYLEKVASESIPEDLEFPGTFLVTWGNGDKTIVSAYTRVDMFLLLDEADYPGSKTTFKKIDEGCAVHFKRVGEPLEDCESDGIFQFEMVNEGVEEEIVGVPCS